MAGDTEICLEESLSLQMTEVEMLRSMFPRANEFSLDESVLMSEIESFINGKIPREVLNTRIGFTLILELLELQVKLEVICQLPHEYPFVPPNVFLRAPSLTRSHHSKLTDGLLNYIDRLERGELYIGYIIQWLQDNSSEYINLDEESVKSLDTKSSKREQNKETFSRMWIYSHHLYSKIKRKDLLFYAGELSLTGFSMTGKPGMIVVEGLNSHVEEFWGRVRRWQWKRIVMKEKEDSEIPEGKTVDDLRKFGEYCERYFAPRQARGRAHHGDRGMLFSFLEEKECGHIFPLFFGVEGRPAEPDSD